MCISLASTAISCRTWYASAKSYHINLCREYRQNSTLTVLSARNQTPKSELFFLFCFLFSGKDIVQVLLAFHFSLFLHIVLLLFLDICIFVYMEIKLWVELSSVIQWICRQYCVCFVLFCFFFIYLFFTEVWYLLNKSVFFSFVWDGLTCSVLHNELFCHRV